MIKMTALLLVGLMIPLVAASSMKIYPINDVYTDNSHKSSNFNTESLRVGNDVNFGKHRTYLQFDLSVINGEISEATLSLDPLAPVGVPNLQLRYVSDDSWNEDSVTWNTPPNEGALIDSKLVSGPDRIEFNVTTSVLEESDEVLSLALTSLQESTENIYVQFFSSEFAQGDAYWPYIEVVYEGSACNTDADTNCNGCVQLTEVLTHINQWKTGQATITELLNSINLWKTGDGC